ncbi:hypothetical protein Bhyg_03667 [Pseudolycoriella hygida]|uniref:Uncharacterized protein n=1 Tax=Pseudolycoriella hygida TaxID=35572 RepID=A0A9Q0NFB5_9DIPT|nr:hypothetical protein Bhyg_03667 [Pseudolycoriella hygida]
MKKIGLCVTAASVTSPKATNLVFLCETSTYTNDNKFLNKHRHHYTENPAAINYVEAPKM